MAAFLLAVTAAVCSPWEMMADGLTAATAASQKAATCEKTSSGTEAFSGKKLAVFGNSITAARNSWAFRVRDSALSITVLSEVPCGAGVSGRRVSPRTMVTLVSPE